MKLSVAVMAHPKREHYIPSLLKALDFPKTVVIWDQKNDRWDTGRRSLLAYDHIATHHLVIQDDAWPAPDLIDALHCYGPYVPARCPISLYTGNVGRFLRKMNAMTRPDTSWMIMPGINWGPGLVIPTRHINDLVTFCDHRPEPNYDLRISRYFEKQQIKCWYTLPSLVEHRDGPSLVPGRNGGRQAWKFIKGSALDFDPSGPVARVNIVR
jgi:hypothetical protein